MSKIAFLTVHKNRESKLSPHFGMAKWVLMLETRTGSTSFEQNTGLTGRSVVDILLRNHCEEVVFTNIGPGALRQLKEAGIGGWIASGDKPALELADDLSRGHLRLVRRPTEHCKSQSGRHSGPSTSRRKTLQQVLKQKEPNNETRRGHR